MIIRQSRNQKPERAFHSRCEPELDDPRARLLDRIGTLPQAVKRSARSRDGTGMAKNPQSAPPAGRAPRWWPSKYGADDQAGALNEITPAKVLEAARLVRRGQVYDLAHVLHQDIPAFPGRTFRQYLTTNYHQINRRHPTRARRAWGITASTGSSSKSPRPSRWAPTWTG